MMMPVGHSTKDFENSTGPGGKSSFSHLSTGEVTKSRPVSRTSREVERSTAKETPAKSFLD